MEAVDIPRGWAIVTFYDAERIGGCVEVLSLTDRVVVKVTRGERVTFCGLEHVVSARACTEAEALK